MRLLLFDIDGTLVQGNSAGKAAMKYALEQVFGTAGPIDNYQMSGKTDPRIITDLMNAAGIPGPAIEAKLPDVYELMAESGRTLFAEKGMACCPGVPDLLAALSGRTDFILGLLTGNISATSPLKLAAAGIDPQQFRLGAYGNDQMDRNLLPAVAMQRAAALTSISFIGENTIIIGDTPADIACARAGKATAIAVASGSYSMTALAQYQPDHLFENLLDTTAVLESMKYDV